MTPWTRAATKSRGKLAGVELPDPVFFCTIEPPSIGKQKQLDGALVKLAKEDPSLRVVVDEDSNEQIILQGKSLIFNKKKLTVPFMT